MSTIITAAASPVVGKALGIVLLAVVCTSPIWLPIVTVLAVFGR
jgi:sorbitol-specific phosphotransferase system component IIBC